MTIEYRSVTGRSFKKLATAQTDSRGYFTAKVSAEPGFYRYKYSGGGVASGETGVLALSTR